jgi:hypothetical protein
MIIFTCFLFSIAVTFWIARAFHCDDLSEEGELLYLQGLQKQLRY